MLHCLSDYVIPKDTLVTSVLYHVMSDRDYWKDPENFRPERFLNEEGTFKRDERLVPYGIGKICLPANVPLTPITCFFLQESGSVRES